MNPLRVCLSPIFCLLFAAGAGVAAPNVVARTDIPFGNAANLRVVMENSTPTVRFTPHPHGGPESLWFCFRVAQARRGSGALGKVRVVLENPDTLLGGGNGVRFRPVFRPEGGDWERAGAPKITLLADGRQEAAWDFQARRAAFDLAFCYPYGRQEIERLIRDTGGNWKPDIIGVSQAGRPLVRLSNDCGQPKSERPGVYLLARQHSGEVSGSWVLDGVLRRFAELGEKAPLTWVVPFANIDGVEQGDYGKDNFPYDLNRAWGTPPMRHEVLVLRNDLRRWTQRCRPLACFDFHSPGGSESDGIYAYLNPADKSPEINLADFAAMIAGSLGKEFAADKFTRHANYKSRWETPRFTNFCLDELRVPALTFEVPYAMAAGDRVLRREDYQRAGARVADAIVARAQQSAIAEQ